jgi:hypothetical protein
MRKKGELKAPLFYFLDYINKDIIYYKEYDMKKIAGINYFLLSYFLLTLALIFTSCTGGGSTRVVIPPPTPVATNVPAPVKSESPEEQKIDQLNKQLEVINAAQTKAANNNDKIGQLSSEKDALQTKSQLALEYAKMWQGNALSYKSQETDVEKQLVDAQLDAWKVKLWWMSGICGLLGIIACGIAWGFPILRPVAMRASGILAAIAMLMLVVAQSLSTISAVLGLVPYILIFAGLVGVGYVVIALRHWWKDHHSLAQTIQAIEPVKNQIDDFKDHMLKNVDSTLIDHIDVYRKKLGLFTNTPSDTPDISGK